MSSSIYQSTPLEQAYSLYIAQQIFGLAPSNPSQQIKIPGRNAVPFLTQSNVDRGILRSLWSVADPNNIGTLLYINQFQLLLRLVAMAQYGMLNPSMTFDQMKQVVMNSASQPLNLPTFSSVFIPPQDQLLSMYSNFIINNNDKFFVMSAPSSQDGFGSLSQPSLTSRTPPPSSTGSIVSQGSFGSQQQQPTLSVSDAFADLGESQNTPLPSPEQQSSSTKQQVDDFKGDNNAITQAYDDFGGFKTATAIPTVNNEGGCGNDSDPFGTLGGSVDTPLPSVQQNTEDESGTFDSVAPTETKAPATTLSDDDFGAFEAVAPASIGDGTEADPFGGLGGSVDAPLPSLQQSEEDEFSTFDSVALTKAEVPVVTEADDDFGDFEAVAPANIGDGAEAIPFGGLGGSAGAPLPSLQQNNENECSAFGSVQQPEVEIPGVTEADNDFGGFEAAAPLDESEVAERSEPDPFGALGGNSDAPLPSLQQNTEEEFGAFDSGEQTATPAADDFGSFEAAATASVDDCAEGSESDPFRALKRSVNAPLPAPQENDEENFVASDNVKETVTQIPPITEDAAPPVESKGAEASDPDPFAALGASVDVPLPSLQQNTENESGASDSVQQPKAVIPAVTESDNDFRGFKAAVPPDESEVADATDSDTFRAFGSSVDAPLHSLESNEDEFGAFDSVEQTEAELPTVTPSDDDFGSFEAVAPASIDDGEEGSESDPFGVLKRSVDAPLPSLQQSDAEEFEASDSVTETVTQIAAVTEADDDFGGFEAAATTATNEGTDAGDYNSPAVAPFDDDFGGFEDAAPAIESKGVNLIESKDVNFGDSDPFGDLEDTQNAPLPALSNAFGELCVGGDAALPSLQQTSSKEEPQQNSDLFGNFAGNQDIPLPSLQQATLAEKPHTLVSKDGGYPDPDLFGAFGGSHDAPLPSLQQHSLLDEPQQENDFGNFETAPYVEISHPQVSKDKFDVHSGVDQSGSGKDFGDSDAAPAAQDIQRNDTTNIEQALSDDDFGNFDQAPEARSKPEDKFSNTFGAFDSAEQSGSGEEFGDFNAAPAAQEIQSNDNDGFGAGDDNFGNFNQAPEAQPEEPQSNTFGASESADLNGSGEDFGDFDAAPEIQESPSNENDSFGAFDSGVQTEADDQAPEAYIMPDESQRENFGAFDDAEQIGSGKDFVDFDVAPAAQEIQSHDDADFEAFASVEKTAAEDDFGDFSKFQPPPNNYDAASAESDDDFGDFEGEDFGTFEGAGPISNENATLEKIRALSLQLPESLLRKSGLSGDHVDLGECFEVNIGVEAVLDDQRSKRVQRCLQVLELLSKHNNSKLTTAYWSQIFDVVVEEILVGRKVLTEAQKLSTNDLNRVKKPLQTMIAGLQEYLRIIRSIVATIGDILMLESSAILTIDTWASTWCSLAVLEKPLKIEASWKDTEKEIDALSRSLSKPNNSMSLEMIRRRVSERSSSTKLCQLTLVTLSVQDTGTTTAEVNWQGKDFMACSANFLAHRCPFYTV